MSLLTAEIPALPPDAPRTYAVGHKPRSMGIGPFGMIGTVLLTIGCLFVIVLMAVNQVTAVVFGVIWGLLLLTTAVKDKHGSSVLDRVNGRIGFRRQVRRSGSRKEGAVYQPGVLTHLGTHRLPGVLADSEIHEYETTTGERFTIQEYKNPALFAVTVECDPDGAGLIDDTDNEKTIELYGDWVANLAYQEGLVQLAVTIQTAPDGGSGLRREVEGNRSNRASDLSKAVLNDIVERYPKSASASQAWATFTFRAPKVDRLDDGSKPKSAAQVIAQTLQTRLPHLLEGMPETGAGAVQCLTAQEIIEVVRSAYNPQDRKMFDQIRASGVTPPVLDWSHAGPTASRAYFDRYMHSGCTSRTWEMTGFTTDRVISKAFSPLFEGHPDILVSRTTFLYQPIDPARSAIIAETDHKAAEGRAMNSKQVTARQLKQVNEANVARTAEAHGSSLVNYAILHTATVLGVDDKAVKQANAALDRLGPTARLRLRPMDGVHDSGFAQALGPLGMVTGHYLAIPSSMKNGL